MAFRSMQTFLCGIEQSRTDTMAAGRWANVDGDDVPHAATTTFSDDEADDCGPMGICELLVRFGDQGKCPKASQINPEFVAAVGDLRIETRLVDRPQGIEIVAAGVA